MLHKLFVGFRPFLIIKACHARQETFLGLHEWMHIPFSIFEPSPMQGLLSRIAIVPSLLQQVDQLLGSPSQSDTNAWDIFNAFTNTLSNLQYWEEGLRRESGSAYYEQLPASSSGEGNITTWFLNVTMANVYTHLWAFQIVCLLELERLEAVLSHVSPSPTFSDRVQFRYDQEKVLKISSLICSSMDYLIQNEMGLFGPASTFFPLHGIPGVCDGQIYPRGRHCAY
ncbi:hypothetical protein AJ79_08565 [Helicocarpus griseus UAMH5409]|uniref:Transcription factor domain-containing protein n=1 Tax=Helicocarpus griseus UAMH5409 TaxID=1447875 RepID=A0A2B7WRU5_9EURO|nr:hypothetical protein AJ79_08565 [Helicocarpus griseus UAMH5409]